MTADELQAVLDQDEGISVEFKRCGNLPEQDVYETICAFANRQGGSLFLGVLEGSKTESGRPEVLGVRSDKVLEIERNITNCLNNPKLFNIPPTVEFERVAAGEKTVLRIWVTVTSAVHSFKKTVYDRIADADVKVTTDTQLSAMYIRKQEYYSERRVY